MTTHAGPSLQNYATPDYLVRALERELGRPFDLDVCAEPWSAKAKRFYSKKDDGLTQPWARLNWCNPPYARQDLWLAKAARAAAERGLTTFSLVLASTSAVYWLPLVWGSAEVEFFHGRISFIHPRSRLPQAGFDRASALVIHGPRVRAGALRVRSAKTWEVIREIARGSPLRRRRAA